MAPYGAFVSPTAAARAYCAGPSAVRTQRARDASPARAIGSCPHCRSRTTKSPPTLGLDAATGLPDDGAIAIEIDVGAPRKKGREGPEGREEAPQVDAPAYDFSIKSLSRSTENGGEPKAELLRPCVILSSDLDCIMIDGGGASD